MQSQPKRIGIFVIAYNAVNKLDWTLDRIPKEVWNKVEEVFLFDDCSTDNTEEVLKTYMEQHPDFNIQYHKHPFNAGKGAALHTGISKATGNYVIIQDADLEYDPDEYNILQIGRAHV